jgi:uncharacterized protein YutE (UPF0331/DUF86 family)
MKYNGVIESKLRIIEQKLAEIDSWDISSFNKLSESTLLQNAVERALQVSIEVMIDISERILALSKERPLPTAQDNINRLQEMGVLRSLPEYGEMVKFRNYIVHRYDRVDLEIVYGIIKNKLFLFREFIKDIRNG